MILVSRKLQYFLRQHNVVMIFHNGTQALKKKNLQYRDNLCSSSCRVSEVHMKFLSL